MPEAPRWRLTSAHYLLVPELPDGTKVEWEHKETARETGRSVRKLYQVPMLLDPKDSDDCNQDGDLVVAHAVDGAHNNRRDYIFIGDPTPEMEPLNDAAQAISDSLKDRWAHPIDSMPANGGMSSDEQVFMEKMMTSFAREVGAAVKPPDPEKEELKERLARLEAMLAPKAPERRV